MTPPSSVIGLSSPSPNAQIWLGVGVKSVAVLNFNTLSNPNLYGKSKGGLITETIEHQQFIAAAVVLKPNRASLVDKHCRKRVTIFRTE
jgi:hypothetical protein